MKVYTMLIVAVLITVLDRQSTVAQNPPTEVTVGLHYGFDFSDGRIDNERIGVQGYVGLVGVLGISAVVSHIPDFFDIQGLYSGSAQESFLTVRVRPWGPGTAFTVGYGAAFAWTSVTDLRRDVKMTNTERTDVGVLSLEIPVRRIRPFAELYLLNLLKRGGQVVGNAHFGINIRAY